MHKLLLALSALILGIFAVFFGINSLLVSSKEIVENHAVKVFTEIPIINFKEVELPNMTNTVSVNNYELSLPDDFVHIAIKKDIICKTVEDFKNIALYLNIPEKSYIKEIKSFLGNEYISEYKFSYKGYNILYRPSLCINIVGYGDDLLIVDTENRKYNFFRGILPFRKYSSEIAKNFRESKLSYFLVFDHEFTQTEKNKAEEELLFPFCSQKFDDIDALFKEYSGLTDEELKWKIKGKMYRAIEKSLNEGYFEVFFPSDIKVTKTIEESIDSISEIPVNLLSNKYWSN